MQQLLFTTYSLLTALLLLFGILHVGGKPSHLRHQRQLQCQTTMPPTGAPTSMPVPSPPCFSSNATVFVKSIGLVPMRALQVGQEILVDNDRYQKVYAFGHRQETKQGSFLQIFTTASSEPLEVTPQHLLFVHGRTNPVQAAAISAGDVLQGAHGNDRATVIETKHVVKHGLYSPLTADGTLVVNGVKASSYISLQKNAMEFVEFQGGISSGVSQHHMVHMTLSPFRIFCQKHPHSSQCRPSPETGMPKYVEVGFKLAEWLDSLQYAYQRTLFVPYTFSVAVVMYLEYALWGANFSPFELLYTDYDSPSLSSRPHWQRLLGTDDSLNTTDDDYYGDDCAPDDDTGAASSICFSGTSMVSVKNRGPVMMKDLQVNDCIESTTAFDPNHDWSILPKYKSQQAINDPIATEESSIKPYNTVANGNKVEKEGEQRRSCQKVYAFAHKDITATTTFLVINLDNSKSLEITAEHLVFLQGKRSPVPARSLQVGDVLQGATPSETWTIQSIHRQRRVGLYAPLTPDGTLLVEDVRVSSYVSLQSHSTENVQFRKGWLSTGISHHDLAHFWLTPYRAYCMHIVSGCESVGHNGYPEYVEMGLGLARVADTWSIFVQIPVFLGFRLLMIAVHFTERALSWMVWSFCSTVGASISLILSMSIATFFVACPLRTRHR